MKKSDHPAKPSPRHDAFPPDIPLSPTTTQSQIDVGDARFAEERYSEAIEAYLRAIGSDPSAHAIRQRVERACERILELGISHHRANRIDQARNCYEAVLMGQPDRAEIWRLLGFLEHQTENYTTALAHYNRALDLKPDYAQALNNRGNALLGAKKLDEALVSFDRALALKPDYVEAFNNRGVALKSLKRFDQALASFDSALALVPDHAEALSNRGNVLQELERFDEALASYDRALTVKPNQAGVFKNRGVVLTELLRLDEASASFEQALALKSDYASARNSRGLLRLLRGDCHGGWADCESRWEAEGFPGRRPRLAAPRWHGENITGRRILVFAEQGLGDVIQFARYMPRVVRLGARVTFLCPAKLVRLLQSLDAQIEFINSIGAGEAFDFQCALMSLPLAFGDDLESIPNQIPYLKAESELIERWNRRVGHAEFRIGVAWQGKPNASIDRGRSFPLSAIAPLARVPGVRLFSLQKNDGLDQLQHLPAELKVENLGNDFDSGSDAFIDTAAVMSSLDLVVSSDTSVAHLAGALGCRTWVALKYVPDWRWLLDRDDSPWYPTMRLFRQKVAGDWNPVFSTIEKELRSLLD